MKQQETMVPIQKQLGNFLYSRRIYKLLRVYNIKININIYYIFIYSSTQRVAELDRRIRELNEERADMYKTQSENAQRLVNLNEQLRTREEKDIKQTDE